MEASSFRWTPMPLLNSWDTNHEELLVCSRPLFKASTILGLRYGTQASLEGDLTNHLGEVSHQANLWSDKRQTSNLRWNFARTPVGQGHPQSFGKSCGEFELRREICANPLVCQPGGPTQAGRLAKEPPFGRLETEALQELLPERGPRSSATSETSPKSWRGWEKAQVRLVSAHMFFRHKGGGPLMPGLSSGASRLP